MCTHPSIYTWVAMAYSSWVINCYCLFGLWLHYAHIIYGVNCFIGVAQAVVLKQNFLSYSCANVLNPRSIHSFSCIFSILLIVTGNKGRRAISAVHGLLCIAIGDHNNDLKAMQDMLCKLIYATIRIITMHNTSAFYWQKSKLCLILWQWYCCHNGSSINSSKHPSQSFVS